MGAVRDVVDRWRIRLRGTAQARDVTDAAAVLVLGVLLIAVGLRGTNGGVLPDGVAAPTPWWYVLLLVVGCGLMLAKRRRPVLVLLAVTLLFVVDFVLGGSVGVLVVFVDVAYSAALHAGDAAARRLRTACGVVVALATAGTFIIGGDLRESVLAGLYVFALVATPVWWGTAVRRQAELAELATARAKDHERLAALRQEHAVRSERAQMARDLHDAIAGNLSAIAIHAEAALAASAPAAEPTVTAVASETDPGGPAVAPAAGSAPRHAGADRPTPATSALTAIREASIRSLAEMRSMIVLLREGGTPAGDHTSPARLSQLPEVVEAARGAGLTVRVTAPSPTDLPALPVAVEQAAYRIIQEALTNVTKHTPGGAVDVSLEPDTHGLRLRVASTPTAGTTSPERPARLGSGVGLVTMRERAEALGGSFSAGWQDEDARRWVVQAVLPGVEQ